MPDAERHLADCCPISYYTFSKESRSSPENLSPIRWIFPKTPQSGGFPGPYFPKGAQTFPAGKGVPIWVFPLLLFHAQTPSGLRPLGVWQRNHSG